MYDWFVEFVGMLNKYTQEELKKTFVPIMEEHFEKVKMIDEKLYNETMNKFYILTNGYHFNEYTACQAVKNFENADGTTGEHWSYTDTTKVAQQNGILFKNFNAYDWYYVLNMCYSDFCKVLGSDTSMYIKLAVAWLNDKDAPSGKAYRYYVALSINE